MTRTVTAHLRGYQKYSNALIQLFDRCAGSALFNFIEACADTSPRDKARFFRYSRREVNESYGILWRQHRRKTLPATELQIARYYADRLSRMIWGLMKTGSMV